MKKIYLLILFNAYTFGMDLEAQREEQAAQEISRLEAFMTSEFNLEPNGTVTYAHFLTRTRHPESSTLNIVRCNTKKLPPFREHVSSLYNYLSSLNCIMQAVISGEKSLLYALERYTSLPKKVEGFRQTFTSADQDATIIQMYQQLNAQELSQIAAIRFYAFMNNLDLDEYTGAQEFKNIAKRNRIELIEAFDKQSIPAIIRASTKLLHPYQFNSVCVLAQSWILEAQEEREKRLHPNQAA